MSAVRVDFRKWPDRKHWQFSMFRLGEDEHGVWLWAPSGTPAQRGDEPPQAFGSTAVKVITRGKWWTAIWNERGTHELYVDIATPAVWNGDTVTMVDLDLDVGRLRSSGEVVVHDADEFEEHRVAFGYPGHLVDMARTTTAQIALDVANGVEPFGSVAAAWLARAAELGSHA